MISKWYHFRTVFLFPCIWEIWGINNHLKMIIYQPSMGEIVQIRSKWITTYCEVWVWLFSIWITSARTVSAPISASIKWYIIKQLHLGIYEMLESHKKVCFQMTELKKLHSAYVIHIQCSLNSKMSLTSALVSLRKCIAYPLCWSRVRGFL